MTWRCATCGTAASGCTGAPPCPWRQLISQPWREKLGCGRQLAPVWPISVKRITAHRQPALLPCRWRPNPGAPPRALLPPLHGKEQECLRLLGLPGSCHAGPAVLCCITGGEDCLLRQQLLPLHPPGGLGSMASPPGAFACSALLAEHAQGTAVKTLALLPMPARGSGTAGGSSTAEWLLLSAGARQVLMACRLRQDAAPARQPGVADGQQHQAQPLLPLLCDELAVKEPPALPWRPKPGVRLGSKPRQHSSLAPPASPGSHLGVMGYAVRATAVHCANSSAAPAQPAPSSGRYRPDTPCSSAAAASGITRRLPGTAFPPLPPRHRPHDTALRTLPSHHRLPEPVP